MENEIKYSRKRKMQSRYQKKLFKVMRRLPRKERSRDEICSYVATRESLRPYD